MRTLTCKHKIWGENWLYLRPYLKAFPVFNVLETCREYLNKPYRYLPPHRVGFLRRFGLKTGTHFAHFGLESGMVFEGTTESKNVFYRFNSK